MDRALTAEPVAGNSANDSATHSEPPLRPRRRPAAWAAGLLLVVPAVISACRLLDTDGISPVPQLLSVLPWLSVPAGLAVLLAAFAGRRALTLLAVVVLGAVGWSSLPYMPQLVMSSGLPITRVTVLAANVEYGQATGALTEAWWGSSAAMGMPGATAEIGGMPVRLQLAHPLPPVPGQVDAWKRELGRIADAARDEPGPLLLAGDFNASQDHAAFRRILDTGLRDAARLAGEGREPSWPSDTTPAFGAQIDHVLVSKEFSASRARFLDLAGTDHRSLLVDLTLHRPR